MIKNVLMIFNYFLIEYEIMEKNQISHTIFKKEVNSSNAEIISKLYNLNREIMGSFYGMYSNTLTTLVTPSVLRAISTASSASLFVTMPSK